MINVKRFTTCCVAVVVAGLMAGAAIAPVAKADDSSTVVSSRSFPKTTTVKKNNLLAEASATTIDDDSKWGSIESLDVPKTKSQAEKDAEAKAKAQAQAEAANRSQQREALNTTTTQDTSTTQQNTAVQEEPAQQEPVQQVAAPAASATGQAIANYASQFVGYPYVPGGASPSGWDCSGFVMWVYSQFGISLPHYSGLQMNVGTGIASLKEAAPGDIIASYSHAAIYIGGGMVVNALNPAQGTMITSIGVFGGNYVIRRVV